MKKGDTLTHYFSFAIYCWGAREAMSPLVGSGCTALVGSIDEASKNIAVLGFLRRQNEYF